MAQKQIVIFGAGGLAREIRSLIRDVNKTEPQYKVLGYVVSDLHSLGPRDSRDEILGDYEWVNANRKSVDAVAIGVGRPSARLHLCRDIRRLLPDSEMPPLIHPSAIVDHETVTLGQGCQICAGAVVAVNASLHAFALCNFNCTLGHEAVVGECSVVLPGSNIAGGVVIGNEVLVGSGARILQYCQIGKGATIGAGAVVVCDVEAGSTVFGVPARPMNTVSHRVEASEAEPMPLSSCCSQKTGSNGA